MAGINVDYINPFIEASVMTLKQVCQIDAAFGKPCVKEADFHASTLVVLIGLTGSIKGQVLIAIPNKEACDLASKMMMSTITEMDEIANSAIGELGNMILGNATTLLYNKGQLVDITPPSLCLGSMAIKNSYSQNICIPLNYDGQYTIELYISIKEN